MKCGYGMEELDAYVGGYLSEDTKRKLEEHLKGCPECRMYCDALTGIKNHLEGGETVGKDFSAKVMAALEKDRYSGRKSLLGPIWRNRTYKTAVAAVLICAVLVPAFRYIGRNTGLSEKSPGTSVKESSPSASGSNQVTTPDPTMIPDLKRKEVLTLYFPNSNSDAVVPLERTVEIINGDALERVIFHELQKGPEGDGKNSVIPAGTELLSVETREGTCTLDLSSEFIENAIGGSAYESMLIHSIVNSLTELPEINKVQFLIEGEKREVYTHIIFDEPFSRNENMIQKPEDAPEIVEKDIWERAAAVLEALGNRDMEKLSVLVHPEKGIRFSPYAFVNTKSDRLFFAGELKELLKDTKKYVWGAYDGTGDPIELTFSEYLDRFVYDRDFSRAKETGYQRIIGQGNTMNNVFEAYPDAKIMEYHFPGFEPQYEGLDWVSLRLVFERKAGEWYLVGIVHDQWTI